MPVAQAKGSRVRVAIGVRQQGFDRKVSGEAFAIKEISLATIITIPKASSAVKGFDRSARDLYTRTNRDVSYNPRSEGTIYISNRNIYSTITLKL